MTLGGADAETIVQALKAVRSRRASLAALERELVATARRLCVPWREIAEALGITTQAAHARFRALDPTSRRRTPNPLKAELDALYASVRAAPRSGPLEGSDPSTGPDSRLDG